MSSSKKGNEQVATQESYQGHVSLIRESKKIINRRKNEFSAEEYKTLVRTLSVMLKDEKTSLYKYDVIKYIFEKEELKKIREKRDISLLTIDLDGFKRVNDRYGHQEGDKLLRRVGEVIKGSIRFTDIAARYGGDEFTVLLWGTNSNNAEVVAYRIKEAIANDEVISVYGITTTIGVSESSRYDSLESMFGRADKALYEGKRTGKNKYVVSSKEELAKTSD